MEQPRPGWRYTDDELRDAVAQSHSIRSVLGLLGLSQQGGGSYSTIRRRISQLDIDTSHFTGQGWSRGLSPESTSPRTRALSEVLVTDSPVLNYGRLKSRLIRTGMLAEQCQICGLGPVWNGARLVLRMDHVNGDRRDNRLENLRLVCPNCDSQLPTFAGRNRRRTTPTP